MDGLAIIDKEAGMTSRDVDNRAKRMLNEPGVGHLGTLDPFATGVLILGIGQGTKLFPFMEGLTKEYTATLVLGEKTDTGENTGTVIETKPVPPLTEPGISSALKEMEGKQDQVPPRFSAKHVNGKRAYDLAREGKAFALKPVPIEVFEMSLLGYDPKTSTLRFRARVSAGTYIRTLGESLAEKLGTVGHLTQLRRDAVGPYRIQDAISLSDLSKDRILPLAKAVPFIPVYPLNEKQAKFASTGRDLFIGSDDPVLMATDGMGNPLAIYRKKPNGSYGCARGFARKGQAG